MVKQAEVQKGARNRGGLDVEAAGGMAEVQKRSEIKACRIGRQSCGRHVEVRKGRRKPWWSWTLKLREACGSPKGARKRDGFGR